jgi:hypothetical protein
MVSSAQNIIVRISLWLTLLLAPGVASAEKTDLSVDQPRFYIMRHLNRTRKGDSLSQAGLDNACRLARWFTGKPLTAIYFRDFARTADTAKRIAQERGITSRPFANTTDLISALRASRRL